MACNTKTLADNEVTELIVEFKLVFKLPTAKLVASSVPPGITPFNTRILQLKGAVLATGPMSTTISPGTPR